MIKFKDISHKYIVPITYTLLWGLGLLLCGVEMGFDEDVLNGLENGRFFVGALVIYVIFIMECVVAFIDTALTNLKSQFNVNLLFLLIVILLNLGVTLLLSGLFIFRNTEYSQLIWLLLAMMMLMKLTGTFFANNINIFMVKLHSDTKTSTLRI